jgi:glycosyltransferase A (GT-A) superfamily protein (DUF2064 family)
LSPHRLVIVFARAPQDERLAKPLVKRQRRHVEELHRALLERALAAAAVDADVRLVTTGPLPALRRLALAHVAPHRLQLAAQAGTTFSERLERAMQAAFSDGYRHVVVIGGDAPNISRTHVEAAFAALDAEADAVLGPARDGGYYLLALSSFTLAPFRNVTLPTANAFAQTRAALAKAGLRVAALAPLDDVDDARALPSLARSPVAAVARAARALIGSVTFALDRTDAPRAPALPRLHFSRGPPVRI